MRFEALATDYDGTIAHDGIVDQPTLDALERGRGGGLRLIMVTGRELDDLFSVFPHAAMFERIVAENGASIYDPATRETEFIASPPPRAFIERLKERIAARDAKISVKAFQTQLKAIKRWGRATPADLSAVTQPTLIANGDNDRMVPSVLSEDLHRQITGSQLIIYPNSGHGGIFQYHREVTAAAIEFLDR